MSTNLAMLTMDTPPGLVHRTGFFWFVLALLHIAQLQPALSGEEVVGRSVADYFAFVADNAFRLVHSVHTMVKGQLTA